MPQPFPYLLLPSIWATRNRAARRERGDLPRAMVFGGIALVVASAIFAAAFWIAWQLADYAELGDYLLRAGLSWLFLTFLSFLAFSGVVTALSTFFLSDDLRLLLAAPVPPHRLFHARFARTLLHASWMVVVFLVPLLVGIGLARCAPVSFYALAVLTIVPFSVIPVALGTAATLLLVNVFPARRARDILMLMGLLFAASLVILLRYIRPERLMHVESLPDITAFFSTLQSPITPFLPSFWAGETLFASLQGGRDLLHFGALWTTALMLVATVGAAYERWHFTGFSNAQEARKARFTRLRFLDSMARALPGGPAARHLFVKDLKVFLRDTTQWSQLLLLLALMLVYLYNFRVLDLDRIPYLSGVVKNAYAFVNLAMAAFVLSAVAVRFVFPSVSAEGPAFWVIRTSPVPMRSFLWSKFWTGLVPVLIVAEALTVASNYYLGAAPFLRVLGAVAIFFMTFALVGLATGMGAIYPRFNAENLTQVAGSYGGIGYMVLAVLFILVEVALLGWSSSIRLWHEYRGIRIPPVQVAVMVSLLVAAVSVAIGTFWTAMQRGIRALEALGR